MRNDHYIIESGLALGLYEGIAEAFQGFGKNAIALSEELGGVSMCYQGHAFDPLSGCGISGIAFKADTPPKGWKQIDANGLEEGLIACAPKKNTKIGNAALRKMKEVALGPDKSRDLYKLFSYEGEVIEGGKWYMPTAGMIGDTRIVIIPRKSETPPVDAPEGARRIEEWEYKKLEHEAGNGN